MQNVYYSLLCYNFRPALALPQKQSQSPQSGGAPSNSLRAPRAKKQAQHTSICYIYTKTKLRARKCPYLHKIVHFKPKKCSNSSPHACLKEKRYIKSPISPKTSAQPAKISSDSRLSRNREIENGAYSFPTALSAPTSVSNSSQSRLSSRPCPSGS